MRILLHSPKDMVAGLLAAAAVCAIVANALFLQAGRHPSPMFGSVVTLPAPQAAVASPLPRPRPVVEARAAGAEAGRAEGEPSPGRSNQERRCQKSPIARNPDAMTNLVVKSTGAPAATPANVVRPPAPIPVHRAKPQARAAWRRCSARSPNMATAS